MIVFLILIPRKKGLTQQQFVDYYEDVHVPLVQKLMPPLVFYRRNYLQTPYSYTLTQNDPPLGFDVITEIRFEDRSSADQWFAKWMSEPVRERIIPDEMNHVDRDNIRVFEVDYHGSL
ncbi:hypothetical protein DM806_17695 [Sphingobium lactosutens]|uniref:EthD domain-containing protein n=1 Tax=Sphingobium lactosutens TaxID=522773 RepID=UPI0015B7CEAA|nr:EthD domain-containing protein [Sphingobium lactosutens]NWK97466.1 hypothetical protein [Sphingobium lactosutens]